MDRLFCLRAIKPGILRIRTVAVLLISLLIIQGCGSVAPQQAVRIFDFQAFFKQQAVQLNASSTRVNKTITDKDNVYSSREQTTDWQKELSMFRRLSVIKPEQESMYAVDTLRSDRGFTFITYTSDNPALKLQMAEVMLNPDKKVEKISLIIRTQEKVNNSDITLTYLPLKGYDIKGDINSIIAGDRMLDIHAECVN